MHAAVRGLVLAETIPMYEVPCFRSALDPTVHTSTLTVVVVVVVVRQLFVRSVPVPVITTGESNVVLRLRNCEL